MQKEILEITPAGGIYCLVDLTGRAAACVPQIINCARPSGYAIQDLLQQIRLMDENNENFATDGDILRWGLAHICEISLGRALAHDARFDGWSIVPEDGSGNLRADARGKIIFLPRYAESVAIFARNQEAQMQLLFNLIKALRLIWQSNSYSRNVEDLAPQEYLKYERILEADGDLCALFAAYQLREAGDHTLWRYVLSSDFHGLAIMLCECLEYDSSPDNILDTLGFSFQDWFLNETRLAKTDHVSLTKLDVRADDFGYENLEFEDVIQLSMLPEGYSYLEYLATEILNDEFYTKIAEETNAAHLQQIVCESQVHMIEEIGFRDPELARKFFPQSTFETIV